MRIIHVTGNENHTFPVAFKLHAHTQQINRHGNQIHRKIRAPIFLDVFKHTRKHCGFVAFVTYALLLLLDRIIE